MFRTSWREDSELRVMGVWSIQGRRSRVVLGVGWGVWVKTQGVKGGSLGRGMLGVRVGLGVGGLLVWVATLRAKLSSVRDM